MSCELSGAPLWQVNLHLSSWRREHILYEAHDLSFANLLGAFTSLSAGTAGFDMDETCCNRRFQTTPSHFDLLTCVSHRQVVFLLRRESRPPIHLSELPIPLLLCRMAAAMAENVDMEVKVHETCGSHISLGRRTSYK